MKKSLKVVLTGLLLVTMSIGVFGCGNKNEQKPADQQQGANQEEKQPEQQKEASLTVQDGQLRVAMECGYAPFNWTQTDDSNNAVPIEGGSYANGYDVQIAKRIAEAMGKELVIVKTEWDALPPAVQSGAVDLIIAGMSPTAERKESIDFSDNYYRSDLVMVVKKDGAYADAKTLEDFNGASITAQLNTFHYSVIDQIPEVNKLTAMDNFPAMRVALQSGAIDGYVSERPEGISASEAIADFTYVVFDEGKGFEASDDDVAIAAGMKKGNTALADAVNAALADISEEERIEIMNDAIAHQPAVE